MATKTDSKKKTLKRRTKTREVVTQADMTRLVDLHRQVTEIAAAAAEQIDPMKKEIGDLENKITGLLDLGAEFEDGTFAPDIEVIPGKKKQPTYKPWFIDTVDRVCAVCTTALTKTAAEMRKAIGALATDTLAGGGENLVKRLSGELGNYDDKRNLVIKRKSD